MYRVLFSENAFCSGLDRTNHFWETPQWYFAVRAAVQCSFSHLAPELICGDANLVFGACTLSQ